MSNIHIEDSYKIHKGDFRAVLMSYWQGTSEEQEVLTHRTLTSLCREWSVHNFLYRIGYKRERTGSVDLDYPCDRPEWVYRILGTLVWPFIK